MLRQHNRGKGCLVDKIGITGEKRKVTTLIFILLLLKIKINTRGMIGI